jgi:hypothetical protein
MDAEGGAATMRNAIRFWSIFAAALPVLAIMLGETLGMPF